jgi:membrane associated rhomboid family serine protease
MSTRSGSPILETLGAFLIVYVLQIVSAFADLVRTLFVLSVPLTENPWTVVTSVYAHAGPEHLLSNAIALIVFGWPVARATSRTRFHLFFVCAGALAGIAQVTLSSWLPLLPGIETTPTVGVIGASGGVFALLGYLLASNRLSTSVGGIVSVPGWVTALVFVVLAVGITVATASPGAALIAHFTGLVVGLTAGRLNLLATRRRTQSARSGLA